MDNHKILKQKFRNSIIRGTGEAHLIMQRYPHVDFSSGILKASLYNYTYDRQSEGSRELYLSELIALSKQKTKIQNKILNVLTATGDDYHLFNIAATFTKQGNSKARQIIYNRFDKNAMHSSDGVGEYSIIKMDGFEGLKHVADVYGKMISKGVEVWTDTWLIEFCQKESPELKVFKDLVKAGKSNNYIKIYIDSIKKNKSKKFKVKLPKYNYQLVSDAINKKQLGPYQWVKKLSKTDIKKLADDFLIETNRIKLERYMRVFDRVKFPYNYQPILELLKKSKPDKNDCLIEFASGALKYFKGDDIRKYSLECLSKTKPSGDYLGLLVSNYKKGDSKLLTTIARNCNNADDIHSIACGYINIFEANKTKECKRPLEAVYEKLNCGIHRNDIVRILIEKKVLSKKIRAEIKYDSDEETRLLA